MNKQLKGSSMLPEINLQSGREMHPGNSEKSAPGGLVQGSHGVDFASVLGRRVETDAESVVSAEGRGLPERGKPLPPKSQIDETTEGAPPLVNTSPVEPSALVRKASRREAAGDLTEAVNGTSAAQRAISQTVDDAPVATGNASDSLQPTRLSGPAMAQAPGAAMHAPLIEVPEAPAHLSATETPQQLVTDGEPALRPVVTPLADAVSAAVLAPTAAPVTNRAGVNPDLRIAGNNGQVLRGMTLAAGADATQFASAVPAPTVQAVPESSVAPATVQDMLSADVSSDSGLDLSEDGLAGPATPAGSASSAQQAIETSGTSVQLARSAPASVSGAASPGQATSLHGSIAVPVQDSGWDTAVAERVLLMTNNKLQNAELRLSPADLGPLRVELRIEDSTANVNFHASQAVTREALEQAIPRLREMLADSGLQLGRCDVSDSGLGDRAEERQAHETGSAHGLGESAGESAGDSSGEIRRRTAVGLVDTFA